MVDSRAIDNGYGRPSTLIGIAPPIISRDDDDYRDHLPNGIVGVVRSGQGYTCGIRPMSPDEVDFASVKQRLTYCQNNHQGWCSSRTAKQATGLYVIDCASPNENVVPAPPECRYVALSYVWGTGPQPPTPGYSQVVKDAMTATRSLGFQYLWVDKHCIDQSSHTHKQAQINQMHTIYSNAEVTLIDAVGKDTEHGLPGIIRPRTNHQQFVVIDDVVLLQGFPSLSGIVKASPWATRGWTLQEGFLSSRRLFTNEGTLYLCNASYCAEWEEQPVAAWRSPRVFEGLIPTCPNAELGKLELTPGSAAVLAEAYSRRKLTYQSDIFNAWIGILTYLQSSNVFAPWGTPLWEGGIMLAWYHESPAEKVPGIPSWSPLGRQGPIATSRIDSRSLLPYPSSDNHMVKIEFGSRYIPYFDTKSLMGEMKNGRMVVDTCPKFLHIKGRLFDVLLVDSRWVEEQKGRSNPRNVTALLTVGSKWDIRILTEARNLRLSHPGSSSFYAWLPFAEGIYGLVNCWLDVEIQSMRDRVIGLLIRITTNGNLYISKTTMRRSKAYVILLLKQQDDLYERIGYTGIELREGASLALYNSAGDHLDNAKVDWLTEPFFLQQSTTQTVIIR